VYASAETMRDLERVFQFAFQALNPFPGYLKPEPHVIDGPFQLGSTTITPLPVPHGNTMVNGYLFSRGGEKLVAYLSDCSDVPNAIVDLSAGLESESGANPAVTITRTENTGETVPFSFYRRAHGVPR